jgi:hypothetical protein
MPKEWQLSSIQGGKPGDYQDTNNNYWVTAAFVGHGEPVKVVTPDVSKWIVGQSYYGNIVEATNRNGATYWRFKRVPRPEPVHEPIADRKWTPRDDRAIQAQWAIGQSVQIELAIHGQNFDDGLVEGQAKRFMAMIPRVKNNSMGDIMDVVREAAHDAGLQTMPDGTPIPTPPDDIDNGKVNYSDIPF